MKITELLVAQGHVVYATGRNAVALKALERLGANVIQADLTTLTAIDEICAQLPTLDVAILSAGLASLALRKHYRMKLLSKWLSSMSVYRFT